MSPTPAKTAAKAQSRQQQTPKNAKGDAQKEEKPLQKGEKKTKAEQQPEKSAPKMSGLDSFKIPRIPKKPEYEDTSGWQQVCKKRKNRILHVLLLQPAKRRKMKPLKKVWPGLLLPTPNLQETTRSTLLQRFVG